MCMVKRLGYVDIAKGIGIVLVVCSHSDALGLMWLFMGMFVPIFYFCAGYTSSRNGSLKEAMQKRFRKLIVPYLFFNVLLFIAFWHFSWREIVGVFYSRYCLYPLDVVPNVKFLTSGNYPMWFLTSMIVSYFLFYLIIYNDRYRLLLISCYAVLTFFLSACPVLLPWSLDTSFLTALFMYAGMVFRRKDVNLANWWQVGLVAVVYVVLQYFGGNINLSVRMYGTSIVVYFFLGILGSFVVLWGAQFLERTYAGNLFQSLGQHSLTIFCVQMVFIVWAKELWNWLLPEQSVGYLTGMVEIMMALVGGWLLSIVLHKNKYLNRLLF